MNAEVAESGRAGFMHEWGPLIAVCLTMFIVVLDTSMMNVAVPQITKDLDTQVSSVQAAISTYSLVMASLMLAGGKLGDIHGTRRVFIVALFIYALGTLIATFSWNIESLTLGWSYIEGIAAAALLPLSMAMVMTNYSGTRRAVAFGVLGGLQAGAAAVGPIFGGFLTTVLTWRLGFAFEVIIVVIVLLLVRYLRGTEPDRSQTLDLVGTVLSAAALFSIVYASLLAGRYGWWEARRPFEIGGVEFNPLGLSPTPWLIALGGILFAAFAAWARRRERRGTTPLFRLAILRHGAYVTGFATDALQSITLGGLLFIMPLFLQSTFGFDALGAGVAILPASIAVLIVSMTTPNLGRHISPKLLVVGGAAVMAIGTVLVESVAAVDMSAWDLVIPLAVFGIGTGLLLGQITNLTLSAVEPDETNEASGLQNATKEAGTALGVAVIGSLFLVGVFGGITDGVSREVGVELTPRERSAIILEFEDFDQSQASDAEKQQVVDEINDAVGGKFASIERHARVDAFKDAVLAIGAFAVLALVLASFLPRGRLPDKGEEEGETGLRARAGPVPARGL